MGFTIDTGSLLIKGRKGDTASFTFNFNKDMSAYEIKFWIKKNLNDETPVVAKEYVGNATGAVTINLTSDDTDKLKTKGSDYGVYYWGLKINIGTEFAQTLIPSDLQNPPMLYVYPEIVGE